MKIKTENITPTAGIRLLRIAALVLLSSCHHTTRPTPTAFEATVNSKVTPNQATISAKGKPEPVAASRDDKGVQSDFLENILLVKPRNAAELKSFLSRYDGTIISDDTIPQPPAELGITLTAEQRQPTQYKIRINVAKLNVAAMPANGAAVGLTGTLEFSSDAGLRTFAAILDAKAAGFRTSGDYIYKGNQGFPVALFATQERQTNAGPPPTFNDPFSNPGYTDFGATGNQSNVFSAWQFIAAHGIQRRTQVAIIDGGFYLDAGGKARGTDSDFPPVPGRPFQYDIDFDDAFAGDTNSNQSGCGPGNPCWWHGTGSAGVATGIANNRLGEMGTGGQVADPILLRFNGTKDQRNHAIRTALGWGADVVSMSFGGDCDTGCRVDDRDDNPFDDAINKGNRVVFIASAGNGQGAPAVGYDVGSPSFVHPCIEDHVICVGALNSSVPKPGVPNPIVNTKFQYSNFGGQVMIFAPTNIPVMSFPPSFGVDGAGNSFPLPLAQADGPPVPQNFGGTSASAPFVAGVVAMMKAVNPELNHDAVAQILRDTAHAGVAPANRTLDAYAAVKRAAGATAIVKDFFENNDLDTIPANLGSLPPYTRANLNLDTRDRDFFRFDSPNGSLMTLALNYPQTLGAVAVQSLVSLKGVCAPPTLVSDTPIAAGGHSLVYRVPGGPLRLGLQAGDVNAYNMTITFASDTYPIDDFEVNDTVARAKRLSSPHSVQSGTVLYPGSEPRATINATIHNGSDIDFYIVQGARLTSAEKIFIAGFPSLEVYGNDSLINLEVFELKADNSPGPQVANLNGARCAPAPLQVRLDEDRYYLVKVSGSPGRYTLRNGIDGDARHIPQVVHDRAYEVVHPGEPIEHVFDFPEILVFAADPLFNGIRTAGQSVHMRLFDVLGKLVGESAAGKESEELSLAATSPGQPYALEITPTNASINRSPLNLKWDAAEARRTSENLVRNPGAEAIVQDRDGDFADWQPIDGQASPRRLSYESEGAPSLRDMGSKDRGSHLFGSSGNNRPNGIRQSISVAPEWKEAVEKGRVAVRCSGFLGGSPETSSLAFLTITFLDANNRQLDELFLPTIGSRERDGKTGLFPVENSSVLPAGTAIIRVDLAFHKAQEGSPHPAYADNLELTLSEYANRPQRPTKLR
jgi:hypothetical protein